jgi:hypothetical protein
MRIINFSDLGPRDTSGSYLELAIDGFKPLERVQELEAEVSHLIRTQRELLSVFNGKPDAVDSNARLVGHFELHWCGPGARPSRAAVFGLARVRSFDCGGNLVTRALEYAELGKLLILSV